MSLYDRLDLTRSKRRKLKPRSGIKKPIWERIDLTRPEKLKCRLCRIAIKDSWNLCPNCGWRLKNISRQRHCIWVQIGNLNLKVRERDFWEKILADAFAKVFSAFRSVNVFLTTEQPEPKEWQQDFTRVYLITEDSDVDYLGVASFQLNCVTDLAVVRIDKICEVSSLGNLSIDLLSNLIANTIAHEIGHTLGLDHSDLTTDVMHDGLDFKVHSLMPPSFHAEQIILMNHAISKYKA